MLLIRNNVYFISEKMKFAVGFYYIFQKKKVITEIRFKFIVKS